MAWERVSRDLRRGLPAVALSGRALLVDPGKEPAQPILRPRVASGEALVADRGAVGWSEGRRRHRLMTSPLIDSQL